jgi:hypothetical protein
MAGPLVPLLKPERELRGLRKLLFKASRAGVPRRDVSPLEWAAMVNGAE